ncbi:MAG: SRPBCC domain-containing protein [Actinomycetales bacterium]
MTSRALVATRIGASPERVFEAFTAEIGQWWQPNPLLQSGRSPGGLLSMEPGPGGRLLEAYGDGSADEIGRVLVWEPPNRLVLSWRPTSFGPGQQTEVHVRFEPVGDGTRVVVEHLGWDALPPEHAARHGFPLRDFQFRVAEWWQELLAGLAAHSAG